MLEHRTVVICELDYKGSYSRYALTQEEFAKRFNAVDNPSKEPNSVMLRPMVFLWYQLVEIYGDEWRTFFFDLEDGLPDSDIDSGNIATIDYDEFGVLYSYLDFQTCTVCGKTMTQGYVFDSGAEYYCSEDCLHKNFTDDEWREECDNNEDSYWTTFAEDGTVYIQDDWTIRDGN